MHERKTLPKPILIYFEGCPNVEKIRALLRSSGVAFVEGIQDSLPEDHSYLTYSSPSLIYLNQFIFGVKSNDLAQRCSFNLPHASEILLRLNALGFSSRYEGK